MKQFNSKGRIIALLLINWIGPKPANNIAQSITIYRPIPKQTQQPRNAHWTGVSLESSCFRPSCHLLALLALTNPLPQLPRVHRVVAQLAGPLHRLRLKGHPVHREGLAAEGWVELHVLQLICLLGMLKGTGNCGRKGLGPIQTPGSSWNFRKSIWSSQVFAANPTTKIQEWWAPGIPAPNPTNQWSQC